jgi:hypothetical protein
MSGKFEAMEAAMAMNLDAAFSSNDNAPSGWTIDAYRWFVRPCRSGDVAIPDNDQHYFGFVCESKVFLRRERYCTDYDCGVITPWDGR